MSETIPAGSSPVIRKNVYDCLFRPESIAVVGASNEALKPGGRVIKNIKENGYGGKLWAVNPKTPDILGLPTFKTLTDLPEAPDLAIVAIPAKFAVRTLEELGNLGTGAVLVLTAGFGEKDAAGKLAEQEMLRISEKTGMAVIGPNCSGFLTRSYKGKFAGIIPQLPGNAVDIISGSGATVDYVMEQAGLRGLSFGTVVNLGNSIQYGVEDLLKLYDENYGADSARVLLIYMEAVKKPDLLLTHARSLRKKGCSIVGIKSGTTPAGERAAASHTGAMASPDTAVEALFQKAGIIRVSGKAALIDTACALVAAKKPLRGRNICILTDAGGPGVMMSDELFRRQLSLATFKESTRDRLEKILPPEASMANPIDTLPSRTAELTKEILSVMEQEEAGDIDAIAVILGDSGMSDNMPIYEVIAQAMDTGKIPLFPVFSSLTTSAEKIAHFVASGHVFFQDEVALAAALANIATTFPAELPGGDLTGYDQASITAALDGKSGALDPDTVDAVLSAAGFKLAPQVTVFDKSALVGACDTVGFPLVMKVIGPLHKSDVGGVKLGITSTESAAETYEELMRIPDAEGALLQSMVTGTEMILGASREGAFGHLVMFGLGGIYTEVLKDVRFALAPLTAEESMAMVTGIRTLPILKGVRGEKGVDLALVADNLQRLARLVNDFPGITEIDINPLKGVSSALYAVDARMIVA